MGSKFDAYSHGSVRGDARFRDARAGATGGLYLRAVRARLFDPDAVGTYLRGLRCRNSVMQRIVELLSLSRESRGRNCGRISYVNLGISQLGAVYELLLSFSGFFAAENLIELKPKDEPNPGLLEAAYFAPESRSAEFEREEIVYDGNSPRTYPK